ncbi:MAG: HEAT repeat domain-containing protein [Nitrospirales bacterium]|nr:HEAT repeat domain-containing protein [Nitrospirales bacterium]
MTDDELKTMVLDYMEKGFLENIIDMFRHDESLFPLVVDMIRDERMRVRLGAIALVEDLMQDKRALFIPLIPVLGSLLQDQNPTVRGDGAYILGLLRQRSSLPHLLDARNDSDPSVREVVEDAIREIQSSNGS